MHLVSSLIVPKSKTAPVPFSLRRFASRVYILWARLGSVSTRYSALRAYLSSHCIKGRSKPVPWYRNWGALRWRSQNGGSKKLPGGISSTGSAATWTSWFFRKISIDLGDLLDSRWVIIPSSFMAFNHENVQMRANAGCDWADITNEIIIENFQFPEMSLVYALQTLEWNSEDDYIMAMSIK